MFRYFMQVYLACKFLGEIQLVTTNTQEPLQNGYLSVSVLPLSSESCLGSLGGIESLGLRLLF